MLADEINRTPPKTQAALLEAMQEYQVTVGGTRTVTEPFFVLATQNPIEQEGTYPLPEAQLDRFMFNVVIDYPAKMKSSIVLQTTADRRLTPCRAVGRRDPVPAEVVREFRSPSTLLRHAIVDPPHAAVKARGAAFVKEYVTWVRAPGPASIWSWPRKRRRPAGPVHVDGRYPRRRQPVLRHRILTNFDAEAEGITTAPKIDQLLSSIPTSDQEAVDQT